MTTVLPTIVLPPGDMKQTDQIYVRLVDELVDVWRPVSAERLHGSTVYRVLDQAYDRDIETWEFGPGDLVECEERPGSDGAILVAVAPHAGPTIVPRPSDPLFQPPLSCDLCPHPIDDHVIMSPTLDGEDGFMHCGAPKCDFPCWHVFPHRDVSIGDQL